MRLSLSLFLSVYSILSWSANPGDKLEIMELKPFNAKQNAKWSPVVKDVVNHEAPGDQNHYDDLITLAHETCHGTHAYIRNKLNTTGQKANGFYLLENRIAVVIEPHIRKSQMVRYVPTSLRGDRFKLYIQGQVEWDDTPLYVFDEWNAYVNGGAAGVDLVNHGLWKSAWQDGVAGIIEFVVYSLATGMAVRDLDPDYFSRYTQFTEFLAWNIARSMKIFKEGAKMKEFSWDKQDKYYQNFIQSDDAKAMREFATATFGASWTKEVLGF